MPLVKMGDARAVDPSYYSAPFLDDEFSGAASPTTYLNDTFTGTGNLAAHTADSGATYSESSLGSPYVSLALSGGFLTVQDNKSSEYTIDSVAHGSRVTVEASVTVTNVGGATSQIYVFAFAKADFSDWYQTRMQLFGGNLFFYFGPFSTVASASQITGIADGTYTLRMVLFQNLQLLYWDGVLTEYRTDSLSGYTGNKIATQYSCDITHAMQLKMSSWQATSPDVLPLEDHTSDSGHTWDSDVGFYGAQEPNPVLESGELVVFPEGIGAYGEALSNVVPPSANYYVEARVKMPWISGEFQTIGLGARFGGSPGSQDGILVEVYPNSTIIDDAKRIFDVSKIVGGVQTYLGVSGTQTATVGDDWFNIRLEVNGTSIKAISKTTAPLPVTTTEIRSETDSDVTQVGSVWLYLSPGSSSDNTTRARIDWIKAGTL